MELRYLRHQTCDKENMYLTFEKACKEVTFILRCNWSLNQLIGIAANLEYVEPGETYKVKTSNINCACFIGYGNNIYYRCDVQSAT